VVQNHNLKRERALKKKSLEEEEGGGLEGQAGSEQCHQITRRGRAYAGGLSDYLRVRAGQRRPASHGGESTAGRLGDSELSD
jgi:hypothetical protein